MLSLLLIRSFQTFLELDASPIARAILSHSLENLNHCIKRNPKMVMENVFGYTTIQLCANWPQGLEILLESEARKFVNARRHPDSGLDPYWCRDDDYPIIWAAKLGCSQSVSLLLEAGSIIFPEDHKNHSLFKCPRDSLVTIISKIASNRRELLKMAVRELGVPHYETTTDGIKDAEATYFCAALDNAGISIPDLLRVPTNYTVIYHMTEIPISLFSMLADHGFHDWNFRNDMGLTPVMIWRSPINLLDPFFSKDAIIQEIKW